MTTATPTPHRSRPVLGPLSVTGTIGLVLVGLREAVMRAVPLSLKRAIGVGIGLFILFIGFVDGGLIGPGNPVVQFNFPVEPADWVFVLGLVLTIVLRSGSADAPFELTFSGTISDRGELLEFGMVGLDGECLQKNDNDVVPLETFIREVARRFLIVLLPGSKNTLDPGRIVSSSKS